MEGGDGENIKGELFSKKPVSIIFDKEMARHFLIINKINL